MPLVFQCSSASRKFLNVGCGCSGSRDNPVSVLFSEPKIPQCADVAEHRAAVVGFSALQRAENSSMRATFKKCASSVLFQCSSASRKFLNSRRRDRRDATAARFSALQRAENSSIVFDLLRRRFDHKVSVLFSEPKIPQSTQEPADRRCAPPFQCSSASRKFLNRGGGQWIDLLRVLFQCSSASRKFLNIPTITAWFPPTMFQCSSASRKFLNLNRTYRCSTAVLAFQCSSASRKFLNTPPPSNISPRGAFQCSSASRKFLNPDVAGCGNPTEPFQCSSASRKFLNVHKEKPESL